MSHNISVFANSCLKRPIDPISKMPLTAYDKTEKCITEQSSIDSSSTTYSVTMADIDAEKLKDFYRSIPNYNDINHLPAEEFYLTLKLLREKKKVMLGHAIEHIDDNNGNSNKSPTGLERSDEPHFRRSSLSNKTAKSRINSTLRRRLISDKNNKDITLDSNILITNGESIKPSCRKLSGELNNSKLMVDELTTEKTKCNRQRRHHSACSISWSDAQKGKNNDIDHKFDQFFDGSRYNIVLKSNNNGEVKTQSMPSSPLRSRRSVSPSRRESRRSITVPKPFKMTERDEEVRIVNELRSIQKSFSDDMLHQKCDRATFRAKPVPIESRIPLYDKILEDQAMRRAITKINSEAELRAKMKTFSFTKKEEKGVGVCDRVIDFLPKAKKKKRFKARPVPKNLFSNYFYDKTKEEDFFRLMNRRIRAEEMLRSSNLPGTMAQRDRSRLSTPAAHSDLPIDPSPAAPSTSSSDRHRATSPMKNKKKKDKTYKDDFITTSPQPFRFNTADRAEKRIQDITKRIYMDSKSNDSFGGSGQGGAKAYSALDLRAAASGRPNLAALLRAEAVRRRFEIEADSRLAEQRRRVELRQRDRLLRSKPSWHLVKNNHEEDIAMRLQTRRDEERMRREEFLHEMELMYGRVQQQPLLFERYYAPKSYSVSADYLQLSPRKQNCKKSKKNKFYDPNTNTPVRSRKVSINENTGTYNGDVMEYLNKIEHDEKLFSDSEGALDSVERSKV